MAHATNVDSVKRIWFVFILLSIATIVEVALGIIKPAILVKTTIVSMSLLNWIFIILTLYKAYYITWAFMHMEGEAKGFRRAVIWTSVFLISYLVIILLLEGDYIHDVYRDGFVKYNF